MCFSTKPLGATEVGKTERMAEEEEEGSGEDISSIIRADLSITKPPPPPPVEDKDGTDVGAAAALILARGMSFGNTKALDSIYLHEYSVKTEDPPPPPSPAVGELKAAREAKREEAEEGRLCPQEHADRVSAILLARGASFCHARALDSIYLKDVGG
eukprot:761138-Hanusia_phi.AAC.1